MSQQRLFLSSNFLEKGRGSGGKLLSLIKNSRLEKQYVGGRAILDIGFADVYIPIICKYSSFLTGEEYQYPEASPAIFVGPLHRVD